MFDATQIGFEAWTKKKWSTAKSWFSRLLLCLILILNLTRGEVSLHKQQCLLSNSGLDTETGKLFSFLILPKTEVSEHTDAQALKQCTCASSGTAGWNQTAKMEGKRWREGMSDSDLSNHLTEDLFAWFRSVYPCRILAALHSGINSSEVQSMTRSWFQHLLLVESGPLDFDAALLS